MLPLQPDRLTGSTANTKQELHKGSVETVVHAFAIVVLKRGDQLVSFLFRKSIWLRLHLVAILRQLLGHAFKGVGSNQLVLFAPATGCC